MKLIIQLLFVFLAFSYIGLMIGLRFAPPDNGLDRLARPLFIKSELVRRLFFLNRVGDARYQLAQSKLPLSVTMWYPPAQTNNPRLKEWLAAMVQQTVNQSITLTVKTFPQPVPVTISDQDLAQIIKSLPRQSSDEVYILYLPRLESAPTNAGQAINDKTIIIFTDTINSLSEREAVRAVIEQSTLMHEWGHLVGLDHVNQEQCIMNEKVEVYGNRRFQGSNLPTEYCPEELYQLRSILR